MLCVGYSHMVCVVNAAQAAGVPVRAILLKAPLNDRAGPIPEHNGRDLILDEGKHDLGPESKAMLARTDEPVFSFIDGIGYVTLPLQRLRGDSSVPLFDFVLPEEPDLAVADEVEIVPYDAIRERLRRSLRPRITTLRRVAALVPGRLVQIEPPPPAPDRWIAEWLTSIGVEPRSGGAELPARLVRYKMWRVASRIFREEADELGARYVEQPPEALDEEGFMRDELVKNLTHGNLAFGALMLERLRALA